MWTWFPALGGFPGNEVKADEVGPKGPGGTKLAWGETETGQAVARLRAQDGRPACPSISFPGDVVSPQSASGGSGLPCCLQPPGIRRQILSPSLLVTSWPDSEYFTLLNSAPGSDLSPLSEGYLFYVFRFYSFLIILRDVIN